MTAQLPGVVPVMPVDYQQRGGSVDLVRDELLWIIADQLRQHPRSLQRQIGPSEIGHPCARRLGYKLADFDAVNTRDDVAWKPAVGTAVHSMLEGFFDAHNLMFADSTGYGVERFLIEHRVVVGEIGGVPVSGSADLYDRVTATVVDWKCVGPKQLQRYRVSGPGEQYRSQAHLYGRGFALLGHPVDHVIIAFLPRDGEFDKAYLWSEPYDEQVALDALARVQTIDALMKLGGAFALPLLPTADAYCFRCPFFRANSTDLSSGCPGDMSSRTPAAPAMTLAHT